MILSKMLFENDPYDRKRRFLRGLNFIIGCVPRNSKESDFSHIPLSHIYVVRNNLSQIYGLEFTESEIGEMVAHGRNAMDFTKEYCEQIYSQRGSFDAGNLIQSSMVDIGNSQAISLQEMGRSLKYGRNGSEWCDVATGPCGCGAWHKGPESK